MILNLSNSNNTIFKSGTNSEEARKFKTSKRRKWISRYPNFRSFVAVYSDDNLSHTACKHLLMEIALGVIQQHFDNDKPTRIKDPKMLREIRY